MHDAFFFQNPVAMEDIEDEEDFEPEIAEELMSKVCYNFSAVQTSFA